MIVIQTSCCCCCKLFVVVGCCCFAGGDDKKLATKALMGCFDISVIMKSLDESQCDNKLLLSLGIGKGGVAWGEEGRRD